MQSCDRQPKEVRLLQLFPVLRWEYNTINKVCNICRENLVDMCLRCVTKRTLSNSIQNDSETCKIQIGKCKHALHEHCAEIWYSTNNQLCVFCQKEWEVLQ
uniref:RING-box protein pip1 n=2 Tax=Lygus hesperus TaxID=30085 RepID=A0A0A9XJX2_LYGHE